MSDDDRPRPTLEQSLERLRNLEEFAVLCDAIRRMREEAIADIGTAPDAFEVGKAAGGVRAFDDLFRDLLGG